MVPSVVLLLLQILRLVWGTPPAAVCPGLPLGNTSSGTNTTPWHCTAAADDASGPRRLACPALIALHLSGHDHTIAVALGGQLVLVAELARTSRHTLTVGARRIEELEPGRRNSLWCSLTLPLVPSYLAALGLHPVAQFTTLLTTQDDQRPWVPRTPGRHYGLEVLSPSPSPFFAFSSLSLPACLRQQEFRMVDHRKKGFASEAVEY